MKEPLISIVILTWNRIDDLLKSLSSIYRQTYNLIEVTIVDSNSTDGTETIVLEKYPGVRFIRLPYNMGVTGGRNIGLANATGELIILLDDDAEFISENDLSRIVERFIEEPELSIMYFKFILDDGHQWGNFQPYQISAEDKNKEIYTHSYVGCAHCIRSSWIKKIGYLKKEYFREGEEQEYAFRTLFHGGRVLYFPEVVVLHHLNPNQRVHADHMALKLAHKSETDLIFLPLEEVLVMIPWRFLSSFFQAFRDRWFKGYIRGLLSLLSAMPRIIKQRRIYRFQGESRFLIRTLKCYLVEDFEVAQGMNVKLYGWLKVKLTKKYLGKVEKIQSV